MIPLREALSQRLNCQTTGLFIAQSIEVAYSEGLVASLAMEPKSAVFVGRTHDQTWRLDKEGPNFYLDTQEEVPWPPAHGTFELGEAVTFADGTRFQWQVTDFWGSKRGFCDARARRLIEFAGQHLWLHGGVDDALYLPALLFVGLIHRFNRRYEGAA